MTSGRQGVAVLAGVRAANARHNGSAQTGAPAAQGRCVVCLTLTRSLQEAFGAVCSAWVAPGHHRHRAKCQARPLRALVRPMLVSA